MIIDEDFATTDIGRAEDLIGRVYQRGRVRESTSPLRFRQRVRGDERVNVARFQISARTELAVDFEGVLGVGVRRSGQYRATSNGISIDPDDAFLLRPGQGVSVSERLDLVMVNLSLDALTRFASDHAGVRLDFTGVAPLSSVHAARWRQVTDFAGGVLADPQLLRNDMMRQTAIDALFATALTSFPIDVAGLNRPSADTALPSALRRAAAFIDDNADQAIGIEDIAAAARLSVRAVQSAFQRGLSTTPTAYLRMVRLASARDDLLRNNPGTAAISQIARRWGFANLGRFASTYRQQYGELPRETLNR